MPPMPDFIRPDLLNARNVTAGIAAMVLAAGVFFGALALIPSSEEPPPPAPEPVQQVVVAEAAPEPAPEPEPEPEPEPAGPMVLMAAKSIQPGDRLVTDMVRWGGYDGPMNANFAFIEEDISLSVILGAIAKQPIEQDSLITWDKIIAPGAPGFLTSILSPDSRAVTIEADRATTNANIIRPGDRVDVILTHDGGDIPGLAGRGRVAQIIVEDVLVLAVGSTTMASRPYFSSGLVKDLVDSVDATPPNSDTYTLEIPAMDAERVALASRQITLSLRPYRGSPVDGYFQPRLVGFGELLDVEPEPEPVGVTPSVRVIRGGRGADTVLGSTGDNGSA